jgi:hypothetical protein
LNEVLISDWLNERIIQRENIKNNGDKVETFINSSGVIAVILVLFKNNEPLKHLLSIFLILFVILTLSIDSKFFLKVSPLELEANRLINLELN